MGQWVVLAVLVLIGCGGESFEGALFAGSGCDDCAGAGGTASSGEPGGAGGSAASSAHGAAGATGGCGACASDGGGGSGGATGSGGSTSSGGGSGGEGGGVCIPTSCAAVQAYCGQIDDGCGAVLTCAGSYYYDASLEGVCGTDKAVKCDAGKGNTPAPNATCTDTGWGWCCAVFP